MLSERESLDALYQAAHDLLAVRIELTGNTIALDAPAVKALAAAYVAENERRDALGFDAIKNPAADALGFALVMEITPYIQRLAGKLAYSIRTLKRLTEVAPAVATLDQLETVEMERAHILDTINDNPVLRGTKALADVLGRANQWRTAVLGQWAKRPAEALNGPKTPEPWQNPNDTPTEAAARQRLREMLSRPRRSPFEVTARGPNCAETIRIEAVEYPSSRYIMRETGDAPLLGMVDVEYYPGELDKLIRRVRYPAAILAVIEERKHSFMFDVISANPAE